TAEGERFFDTNPAKLSQVDYWDAKERQLMQNAERITKIILEESNHKELLEGSVLFGSLARKDKCPADIDLLLLVRPQDRCLDITKYMEEYGSDIRYDILEITNGLVTELGIYNRLAEIGRLDSDSRGNILPEKASNLIFSEFGGRINLNTLSSKFFSDSNTMEQLMRISFTPTFYRDVLTDGLVYDLQTGKFCIPARERYSSQIDSVDQIIKKAEIEFWRNLKNDRPNKKD
ncbi:MAG: hypothetical protein ABIF10_00060, partial [Candidatus Woesearchaeota archaeon]